MKGVGLDFGTTNSSVAVATPEAGPRLARFGAPGASLDTFRSLLFFERDESEAVRPVRAWAGPAAIARYLDAESPGRLIQSLKSFLASRHFSETDVLGSTYRIEGLIERILRSMRDEAETQLGELGERVVVGRPVRFAHMQEDDDEELALSRLRAAFHNAGFRAVEFEYEPVAAAWEYRRRIDRDELLLIADFGGGTSDFCLLRAPPPGLPAEILGTAGVGVAGDAFDAKIVRHAVAPALGRGTPYRSEFGKVLRVPVWIYAHLERWHHLSFLKAPRTMHLLYDLRREALRREGFEALIHLVENDLGFHLYRSVEHAKAELSIRPSSRFRFRHPPIDIELAVRREEFEEWIAEEIGAIEACLDGLLTKTAVPPAEVDRVFLTGGSSRVPVVRRIFETRFGPDRLRSGGELTSVASGLSLRALVDGSRAS